MTTTFSIERALPAPYSKLDESVSGYPFSSYRLDMGTPEKHLCLNCDLLLLKAKSALIDDLSRDGVYCDRDVIVHPSAEIVGPVVMDKVMAGNKGLYMATK